MRADAHPKTHSNTFSTTSYKHTRIYPGSGPLCGGNTPTPASLCIISVVSELQACSWSCFPSLKTSSLLSSLHNKCSEDDSNKCVLVVIVPRTGGVGGLFILPRLRRVLSPYRLHVRIVRRVHRGHDMMMKLL